MPCVNTLEAARALPGVPLPVSVYAALVGRHRFTVYRALGSGRLPGCVLLGLRCVLVPRCDTLTLTGSGAPVVSSAASAADSSAITPDTGAGAKKGSL